MRVHGLAAVAATMIALAAAAPAQARFWQCVPYARQISGVDIRGNAWTWWQQAAGRYARGTAPREGAVMAFARTARMRLGHVAMVSKVIGEREVRLTHANWSRRGQVEQDVRAIDVSAAGDWSQVRVWFASQGDLGVSHYPVNGFIYNDAAAEPALPAMTFAAASPVPVAPAVRAASFTLDLE